MSDITFENLSDLMSKYILTKSLTEFGEKASNKYLFNEDSLQQQNMQLEIAMKKKALGWPVDDDDYEKALNDKGKDKSLRNILLSAVETKVRGLPLPSTSLLGYNSPYSILKPVLKEGTYVRPNEWASIAGRFFK